MFAQHARLVQKTWHCERFFCCMIINLAAGFRAAWDSCNAGTVVKHMDVEALDVFPMLYAQEQLGAWAVQTVSCQVGAYSPGDYWSWKHWRDTLADVLRV